jgi:hypothetical protein
MGDLARIVIAVGLLWIAWGLSTALASVLMKKGDLKGKLLKRGKHK